MVTGSMPPESEETPAEVQPVRTDRLARVEKRRRVFMGFVLVSPGSCQAVDKSDVSSRNS
jgi:hypothetical protein